MEDSHRQRIAVDRPYFNETLLNEKYSFQKFKPENTLKSTVRYVRKYYKPSVTCCSRYVQNRFPIVKWMRRYNLRDNFLKDLIGGLTIGVVSIPQGMAYSLMADLPAVNGLYVSFFTVIAYFIFGTSRHLSLGTYGVVSLMIRSAIERFEGKLFPDNDDLKIKERSFDKSSFNMNHRPYDYTFLSNHQIPSYPTATTPTHPILTSTSLVNSKYLSNDSDEAKVMLTTALSFLVGIFQIGLGLIHAGVVTKYLSDVIVSAFTTAAAYHVVASQINSLLGILIKDEHLPFKLAENIYEIFRFIKNTNWATVIISLVSMVTLFVVKKFVNEKFKHKLPAPFPIELVIIVFGTLFSYLFDFNKKFGVRIIGNIPMGIPAPSLPPFRIFSDILGDAINIAIVSFALNISMGKLFAKKHNYKIRPNQELFAYGIGNLISSFFKGFPSCVGLSRCVILDGIGVKTQLFSGIASALILVVILGIGFLLKTLPICCLASIIVVALLHMLTDVKEIVPIFRRSKTEAIAWLATFGAVLILDIDSGLYIGLGFSILLVIFQTQRANITVMGNIPQTDIYEGIDSCEDAREIENVKILRYESSIYYANVENFVYKIVKFSDVDPFEICNQIDKLKMNFDKIVAKIEAKNRKHNPTINQPIVVSENPLDQIRVEQLKYDKRLKEIFTSVKLKHIILDLSCVNMIDSMGIEALAKLNKNYKEAGVQLHLTNCKRNIFRQFENAKFNKHFDYNLIYPTIHDAVLYIFRITNLESISTISLSLSKQAQQNSNAKTSLERTVVLSDLVYVQNENMMPMR